MPNPQTAFLLTHTFLEEIRLPGKKNTVLLNLESAKLAKKVE